MVWCQAACGSTARAGIQSGIGCSKKSPGGGSNAADADADADEDRSGGGGGNFVDFNCIAAGRRTAGLQLANHLTIQTHDIGMHVLRGRKRSGDKERRRRTYLSLG